MSTSLEVFGLHFFAGPHEACRKAVQNLGLQPKASSVIFANAHVVVEAHQDPKFKENLRTASLVVPDGVPLTWVMKNRGARQTQRYSGPDFMEDFFNETRDKKHFFLGSSQDVLDKIKTKFKGHGEFYSPPFLPQFDEGELEKHRKLIENSRADFIWVGLGAPKQEKYVLAQAKMAKKGVFLAVGAAFDFYAEAKPRAPKLLQNVGLEWAFRMFTEPRRLAIRYFKTNPLFIKLAFSELKKSKKV